MNKKESVSDDFTCRVPSEVFNTGRPDLSGQMQKLIKSRSKYLDEVFMRLIELNGYDGGEDGSKIKEWMDYNSFEVRTKQLPNRLTEDGDSVEITEMELIEKIDSYSAKVIYHSGISL